MSEPNSLSRLLEKKKRAGIRVLDLTESNPTQCGFTTWNAANLTYNPDPRGLLSARESICAYYASHGVTAHPDRVLLTCGTSEAYSLLFHLLCDPGEGILCARPVYPLVDHLAAYADIEARRLPEKFPENSPAKALALVNPANPTGRYAGEAEWAASERFCERNGAALISDEVFFDFEWEGRPRISGASRGARPPSGGASLHFTLNGVSKMLGLPQMKLAWIVVTGPKKETRDALRRLELLSDSFLSVNTPAQNALPFWLAGRGAFIAEVMDRVKGNFETLRAALGTELPRPEGGWYVTLPLPSGMSDEETALRLLEEKDLLLHPGYFFELGFEGLIVSLLPEAGIFEEGAKRLARGLY